MNTKKEKLNTTQALTPSQILGKILEKEKISAFQFAKIIGVHHQTIGDIVNGKTQKISLRLREKICAKFTDVNPEWLRTGEGEMVKTAPNVVQIAQDSHEFTQAYNFTRTCEECKIVANLQNEIKTLLEVIKNLQK